MRGSPPARSGPPRKRNPERQARGFKYAYHSKRRKKFVGKLPCAGCGYCGEEPRDNAHIEVEGTGFKAHYTKIIPLCTVFALSEGGLNCHGRQHGVNGGWAKIGMTEEGRERAARLTEDRWQEYLERSSGEPD